ncbi:MAG: hypothetical protein GF401_10995 [Chitinivibrionales bacterium]|nr:hypothetical protein [Chitinivibrionales bacterium]
MKRFTVLMLCLFVTSLSVAQFERAPDQSLKLTAYHLSSAEEALFQVDDNNQKSCFWYCWDISASLDRATLDENNWAYGTLPDGTGNDCGMDLMAAYGDRGVYFLFQVTDDDWQGLIYPEAYGNDACELFIDQHSSTELYGSIGSAAPLFIDLSMSQLTESFAQFQIRFGGSEPVENFRYNLFNIHVAGEPWLSNPENFVSYQTVRIDDAEALYGIRVDILDAEGGVTSVRRQEWFVPWDVWGASPGVAPQSAGSELAMTFGYNDLDAAEPNSFTALRWRLPGDPFHKEANPISGAEESVDAWGDIAFGMNLDDFLEGEGQPVFDEATAGAADHAYCPGWIDVQVPINRWNPRSSNIVKTQYFTPGGRMLKVIDGALQAPSNSVILRKQITADNRVVITQGIATDGKISYAR